MPTTVRNLVVLLIIARFWQATKYRGIRMPCWSSTPVISQVPCRSLRVKDILVKQSGCTLHKQKHSGIKTI